MCLGGQAQGVLPTEEGWVLQAVGPHSLAAWMQGWGQ